MANEEANRPNPELCLSPIYRNMYVPGPDISEAMELLDCLGKEPWNQPNASAEERARRRYAQLKEKGFDATLATLIEDIQTRDDRDMNRDVAPLKPAEDAVEIDSTSLSVEQVVDAILDEAARRSLV